MRPDQNPTFSDLLASNAVPDAFTSSDIRRAIERLDSDIARTYGTRSFSTREEAASKRKALQEKKKQYLGILSSSRKIPVDIWALIFSFNAQERIETLSYLQVCKSWQSAMYDPVIWTNVEVGLFYDEQANRIRVLSPEGVMDHFTLAHPLPIDVTITYNLPGFIFDAYLCDAERLPDQNKWRSLTTGPGALRALTRRMSGLFFEMLEEIVVRSPTGCDDDGDVEGVWLLGLAQLRRLTMQVKCGVDTNSIAVPWHQLTHLDVDAKYSDASDYLDILAACSATLESCDIRLNRSPYPPRFLPFRWGSRLMMGRVRRFKLMGRECPALFLTFLRMPELEHLEIVWEVEDAHTRYNAPALMGKVRFGADKGPGRRIADFVRASGCHIQVFRMQAKDVWFSDVGEALGSMREVREVMLFISNTESMPAIDRELDIKAFDVNDESEDEDEDESSSSRCPLLLPYLKEFTIHSSFFSIPLGWFMAFVQPENLVLEEPEELDFYREADCVGFIYERGSLTVVSGYEGLTKEMLTAYLEGGYPGVRVVG